MSGPAEGTFTQTGGGFDQFEDRIKTQEEIAEMVEACFGDRDSLTLKEFQEISESRSSDMLVTILELLKNRLPCSENFYHF